MLPRLGAGERLEAISDRAVSSGMLDRGRVMRALGQLEEAHSGVRQRAAKATPAVLAGMGIGVSRRPVAASKAGVSNG